MDSLVPLALCLSFVVCPIAGSHAQDCGAGGGRHSGSCREQPFKGPGEHRPPSQPAPAAVQQIYRNPNPPHPLSQPLPADEQQQATKAPTLNAPQPVPQVEFFQIPQIPQPLSGSPTGLPEIPHPLSVSPQRNSVPSNQGWPSAGVEQTSSAQTAYQVQPSYQSVCYTDSLGNGCELINATPIPSRIPCSCGQYNGITR